MKDEHRRLNRREVLVGTGLVGAGALAAMLSGCAAGVAATTSPSAAPTTGGQAAELAGAWRIAVTVDDGSHHDALMLCTSDGGVTTTATLPPATVASGYGAWSRSATDYLLTFQAFAFNGSGELEMVLRIHGLITIDTSGDGLSAKVKYDVAPTIKSSFSPGGTANWTGTRIKPLAS